MGKPEAYVENYLYKQSKKYGFLCYKFVSPSNAGVPDRIVIGYGKTIFIETKSKTGDTSPLQKAVIKDMIAHGATVFVLNTREKIDTFFDTFFATV